MKSGVGRLTGCFRIMLQWTGFPLYSSRHSNAFHTQGQTDWPTRETYYNHPQWMYFFRFWLAKTNRSHTDTLFHTVSFTWSGNTNQVGKYTGNRNNQLYLWRILLRDESDSSSGKSADLHVQPSISKGVWQAPITSWGWTYPGPKAQMTHVHMWISTRPLLVAISQWQLVWSFASIPWFCLLLIDTYLQKVPQWNKRIFADTSYLQSAAVLQYESCWKYFFQIIHNSICNVEFFLGQVIGNIEG